MVWKGWGVRFTVQTQRAGFSPRFPTAVSAHSPPPAPTPGQASKAEFEDIFWHLMGGSHADTSGDAVRFNTFIEHKLIRAEEVPD